VFVYVEYADLISRRQKINNKEHEGKTDGNFCWMHSRLLASVGMIEFQTVKEYSNMELTNA
jgi:hypothetical protein